jgi:ferredoxin-NADP reductase/uncharacterized protein YcbX
MQSSYYFAAKPQKLCKIRCESDLKCRQTLCMTAFLQEINRYPLKGFHAQRLRHAQLTSRQGIAFDRRFAITNAQLVLAPQGEWTPCQAFVRLTKNTSLPQFALQFDEASLRLVLHHPEGKQIEIELDDAIAVREANAVLQTWFPNGENAAHGTPQLVSAHSKTGYWDHSDAAISIINANSVAQLGAAANTAIDPARFRGNLLIADLPAWQEFAWLGRRIKIGNTVLEVLRPIDRCSATSVHPQTGEVDLNIPARLAQHAGHVYCGVYARVIVGGQIQSGDTLQLMDFSPSALTQASVPSTAPPPTDWPRAGRVSEIERSGQNVLSFWIQDPLTAHGFKSAHQAGQHIRLHSLGRYASPWRSYTVSGTRADGCVRISVKREDQGVCSPWLHDELVVGSSVVFSGPFGEFTLQDKPLDHITFMSAGIGITPIVAMLKQLARDHPNTPLRAVHVARNSSELALWPDVSHCIQAMPRAYAQLYLSDESQASSTCEWPFIAGRPSLVREAQLAEKHVTHVFICGPKNFTQQAIAQCQQAGLPAHHIHHENFASPNTNAGEQTKPPLPGPFRVHFAKSKTSAVWTEQSGSLLDLAERCGLNLPANCRGGACNACKQTLQSGAVAYTTEPLVNLPADALLLCCSVPVSDLNILA